MEHCHMPLQAGDDGLLARMKRLYTCDSFLEIVRDLRSAVPGLGLTTDIIVGFPGETEEEFAGTMRMIEEIRFDGAYMFIYSPRPGTPAADMEQVPVAVKKERLNRLVARQNEITCEINASYVGRVLEVMIEGPSRKNSRMMQGYSREFKMVHFPAGAGDQRVGRLAKVRIEKAFLWGLGGELV
jgi:tRNA-2-methylthio-N6-dimethylallyladenosine synthase